jgi:hypothetical protein
MLTKIGIYRGLKAPLINLPPILQMGARKA